jgi:uncharacterized protein (TIGR03382 family)
MMTTNKALGPAGAPPPAELTYVAAECIVPAPSVASDGGDLDAAFQLMSSDDAAVESVQDGSTQSTSSSSKLSGSGCGIAARSTASYGASGSLCLGVLAALLRRKRNASG